MKTNNESHKIWMDMSKEEKADIEQADVYLLNTDGRWVSAGSWRSKNNVYGIKIKTWREVLTKKLEHYPDVLERIIELTDDENLEEKFTKWEDWSLASVSFLWAKGTEGKEYWKTVNNFLEGKRDECPPLPQSKPRLTVKDLLVYTLDDKKVHLLDLTLTIEDLHRCGYKWSETYDSERFRI